MSYCAVKNITHVRRLLASISLAYPIQLVILSTIFTILGERSRSSHIRSMLERWLWCGMFGEVYTRFNEARAGRDVIEVPEWLAGGSLPLTIVQADFSFDRLISVRKRYGAVYQGLAALLRREGAIDWCTGEEINDVIYFEEQIDSHYIFPVAWCRKQGIDPKKYNCLINCTPLSAKTNKKIGSKAPSVYLEEFERSGTSAKRLDEILQSHAISPKSLRQDDFERFFQMRANNLLTLIGKAMGKSLSFESFQDFVGEHHNGNSREYKLYPEIITNS
ncbi:hypothetical protein QUB80_21945 [Chlorogloeopsis sp. ULAP01]|uniref:hypothetical protein n=1 Tax=Chlorogloeopsis sp. ULAP01 TaxID=3056483 RepID=UPI0025AA382F|nr:hypothetical protein [Chlorogloeopsis sp. ULAP01]MDM9383359.1 hypothetical protein [Chlorogloeopsis sp. ULAP01]